MATKWTYAPERRAEWGDMAQAIHERLSMAEIVRFYLPGTEIRHRRIACPLHNGRDYNLSMSRSGYKCFVCGASGDIIGFVGELLSLERKDAMRRINQDFRLGLPIDGYVTDELGAALRESRRKALEKENREKKEKEKLELWWDRWCALDKRLIHDTLSGTERMNILQRMNIYAKLIEQQEGRLWEVTHNGRDKQSELSGADAGACGASKDRRGSAHGGEHTEHTQV